MSQHNSTGRSLAERLGKIRGSADATAAHAITLTALGVVCLLEEPTATAAYAVAVALGGFLLIRAVTVSCGSSKPSKSRVASRPVRVHPLHHR